jgi:hypothetical protein
MPQGVKFNLGARLRRQRSQTHDDSLAQTDAEVAGVWDDVARDNTDMFLRGLSRSPPASIEDPPPLRRAPASWDSLGHLPPASDSDEGSVGSATSASSLPSPGPHSTGGFF